MNDELIETLALFACDPLGFASWAFPWGEPGSELEDEVGLETWQEEILRDLGQRLIDVNVAIRLATTSGHGIGKSALVAIIILWAMSTCVDCKGVVTANTENQLKTKTWVELAKWHRMFIGRDLFKMTATRLVSSDPEHNETWRLDCVPWSVHNTEAFAGLHNKGKRILLLFDEASAIPDLIWEVAEGALTDKDTEIIWAVFGNPTKNKGRFRECFSGGKFERRWLSRAIDSRAVRFSNHNQIREWAEDWGEDSDFFRVRVRGVFPRIDSESFIGYEIARGAVERDIAKPWGEPVILGVDVGRFGDDPSVIYPRCGRDAFSRQIEVYQGIDTMELAARVSAACNKHGATAVMVDSGGVGGGVVDRLRQLRVPVWEVDFGSGADGIGSDRTKYANKRAEIWGAMKLWLAGGSIPEKVQGVEVTLVDELLGPNFGLNQREEIQLESKKDMRRRGIKSPNLADALACTFAYSVWMPSIPDDRYKQPAPDLDYNPFSPERMSA